MSEQEERALRLAASVEERLRSMDRTIGALDEAAGGNSALLQDAEEQAALSGRFDPRTLVGVNVEETGDQTVLSRLARECAVEPHGGEAWWLLLNRPRTASLSGLLAQGRLGERLAQPLPPTDLLGDMLRELLRNGARVRLEGRTREELLALSSAVEATADLEIPRPDPARLRSLTKRSALAADYEVLLADGFIGREPQLEQLRRFVAEGDVATPQLWSGLLLTGLGGAGKSTLLARFAKDLIDQQIATVVILDFDRPGIDPQDRNWLEAEMARQVGQQYPDTQETLRELRQEVRQYRVETSQQADLYASEAVEVERSGRSIVSGVWQALARANATARPFVLVLDTFEEVTQRDLVGRIVDWLAEIASYLMPTPLRVVVSGRLYDDDRETVRRAGVQEVVEVDELEPDQAEQLLLRQGVPPAVATRLAHSDVLPRRPLELKLLAELVDENANSMIQELEDELRAGGPAAEKLFLGLVYSRVLLRLKDHDTAQLLAYPGLVLRYVTVPLIQQVLVPALVLPPLEDAEAQRALDALAAHRWLAYRGPDGEVWHRKDLRRSVLKAMIAKEPEKARRINRRAVHFFAAAGTERERAEGIYHRLMLVQSPADDAPFELGELKGANEHIAGDIVDLPPPAAALLRFAVEGNLPVADLKLVPRPYRADACEQTGQRLVDSREFAKALEVYTLQQNDPLASSAMAVATSYTGWEVEALFATASWDEYEALADRPIPPNALAVDQLASLVFPTEVVQPGVVSVALVERLLADAVAQSETSPFVSTASPRDTTLQRLAVGLVLVSARAELSAAAREAVGALVEQIRRARDLTISFVLERRLLLLDLMAPAPAPPQVRVGPSTVKLSTGWLGALSGIASIPGALPSVDPTLGRFVLAVGRIVLDKPPGENGTVRAKLGAVDALATREEWRRGAPLSIDWQSSGPAQLVDLLRGPDPEFRDPCRFALLDAFPDPSSHRLLGELVASVVDIPFDDLTPDGFASALAINPEHALETYVELVDRAWALGGLLRRAQEQRPDAAKLRAVSSAYERWDGAVRSRIAEAHGIIVGQWGKQ